MTPAARLAGRTAAETISVVLAVFARIDPALRKSITFDNDTAFAQHALLRTMRAMTTRFCDTVLVVAVMLRFSIFRSEIIRICSHIHVEPGEVGLTAFLWF